MEKPHIIYVIVGNAFAIEFDLVGGLHLFELLANDLVERVKHLIHEFFSHLILKFLKGFSESRSNSGLSVDRHLRHK